MRIREAEPGDVSGLIHIIKDVFSEYGLIFERNTELPDFINFNKYYRNSDHTLFVMEHETQLIGCGALTMDGTKAVITRIYLSKKFRGRGWGKKLVTHLIDTAKKGGATHLCLWTDTRFTVAHQMYSSLGLTRTEKQRPLNDVNDSYEIYFEMKL